MSTLRTTVVNIRTDQYDILIDRTTKWGNPFHFQHDSPATRAACIRKYEDHIRNSPELLAALKELVGKRLGCWCKPKQCHGDVLIKLIAEGDLE
jgi:hypothetical protein